MDNIIQQVKERYAKALAKVERAEKALDSARSELLDIEAAIRVIDSLSGVEVGNKRNDGVPERQFNIVRMLREGRENGEEPKVLHGRFSLFYDGDLGLDTFRTTIWRMKDKAFVLDNDGWLVRNDEGRYWKEVMSDVHDVELENPLSEYARIAAERGRISWDRDTEVSFEHP